MNSPADLESLRQMIANENAASLRPLHDKVDVINKILTGHDDPSRGIIVRLDRLEQTEANRRVWVTAAIGAAISSAAVTAWNFLTASSHK